jgi:hypothetical protein
VTVPRAWARRSAASFPAWKYYSLLKSDLRDWISLEIALWCMAKFLVTLAMSFVLSVKMLAHSSMDAISLEMSLQVAISVGISETMFLRVIRARMFELVRFLPKSAMTS